MPQHIQVIEADRHIDPDREIDRVEALPIDPGRLDHMQVRMT
ncbi:MAG TPA: hypothetical protein VGO18_21940 [Steroidobacteraceae bacterium]|nr:hypothetical protein [Steroidobacteraceae bacterium]